jgi:hypothetical protein
MRSADRHDKRRLRRRRTAPGFHDNARVVNGFSDLIVEIWGDAGRHARSAPGQGSSPLNGPIIVDAFVAVSE